MASDIVKVVVSGAIALAIGLALGGLGPRAEVRALRTRLDAMTDQECAPSRVPSELAGMLRGQPWEEAGGRSAPRPDPDVPDTEDGERSTLDPVPNDDVAFDGPDVQIGEGGAPLEDMGENLEMAREAMDIRSRAAWRALDEQARPTVEQRVVIEDAIANMNRELVDVADAFAQAVGTGQQPERRDMMVFAADALETMIATEDVIYDTLSPEQRADLDEKVLDPTAYVDASVIDVLQAIEAP